VEAIVMPGKPRDPKLEQFWRATLAARQESGQSVADSCSRRRLSQASFNAWRRTLRERNQQCSIASSLPRLVPLRVVATFALEVVLPSGLVVRVPDGADATAVGDLVAALRATPC
jgi:hypothetical protein